MANSLWHHPDKSTIRTSFNELHPSNTSTPNSLVPACKIIVFKLEHPAKARSLIWVTDAGIIIVSSDEQFANASESIVSTPFSIVRVFRLIQSVKAALPIVLILPGIVTEVILSHPSKALVPRVRTLS